MNESGRAQRKTRVGVVVSDKMQKTVSVKIDRTLMHAVYGRVIRRSSKVLVHDPEGLAGIGDRVKVMETRPLSRRKRWRLLEILEKAK